jgi:protein phosphatase
MLHYLPPFAGALRALASPLVAVRKWFSKPDSDGAVGPDAGATPPVSGPMVARVAARTDTGMQRKHNEDMPLVQGLGDRPPEDDGSHTFELSEGGVVVAVCDGMGGAVAGEIASAIVVETLSERTEQLGAAGGDTEDLTAWLVEGVEEANRRVLERVDREPALEGMGSTVTSFLLLGSDLRLAHVGDSRGYLLRNGSLTQITEDHSFVAKLVAMGKITEEEAQTHSQRNLLLQAVGAGGELDVEHGSRTLQPGDRILLCSDGLSNLVMDEEMLEILQDGDEPTVQCETMVDMANERGGHDNITVVVAHVGLAG